MHEKIVTHTGFIKNVEGRKAEVSIFVNSGCASCEINGSCSISDSKEKIIEVSLSNTERYDIGQEVMVEMKQSLGSWAVLLGYFFPFLVIVISLFAFVGAGLNEGLSALLSLGLLAPYYFLLYLSRGFFSKRFTYTIQ